jgi:hypothetical protein
MFVLKAVMAKDLSLLEGNPSLWRKVRRFNGPGQATVAVAVEAARAAADPSRVGLIGLAACQSGSSEMFATIGTLLDRPPSDPMAFKFNPTYTLHALDNLALSVVSIELKNRGYAIGLGGTAGQCWDALDIARARLAMGDEREFLIFGGDQTGRGEGSVVAAALLLSCEPPVATTARVRIDTLEWTRADESDRPPTLHAAAGLAEFLGVLERRPPGPFEYRVPPDHGNGLDSICIRGALA